MYIHRSSILACNGAVVCVRAGSGAKRRRRVSESEKVDRTDMLAEQYMRKLSGIKSAPGAKQQPRAEGKGAQRGSKAGPKAAGAQKAGKGKQAAAPVVKLDLSGGGSIKRWFDE